MTTNRAMASIGSLGSIQGLVSQLIRRDNLRRVKVSDPAEDYMRRLLQALTASFKMPLLYRDNLSEIERILRKDLNRRDFSITVRECEYDSVDEIPKDTPPSSWVEIKAHDRTYITIDLYRYDARLYVAKDDMESRGAFAALASILMGRERKIRYFFAHYSFLPFVLLLPL